MHKFEQAYSRWVMNNRVLIIIATLVLVTLVGRGMGNLEFTNNYRVFFGADNPELLAFEALEKTYSKNDNVLFVITPKNGNIFTPKTLAVIKDLTDKSWQIPYSTRVDSITNYQHSESLAKDDLKVGDLVKVPSALTTTDLNKIKNVALNEPLLNGRLISADGETAGVNITINLPGKDLATENPEVVAYVRKLAEEVKKANPDMEVRLTGMVMMNAAFNEASIKDMKSLVLYSFIVMLVFLGFLVRSIAPTIATFVVIMLSIITSLGIGGFIGFPMTPPSASAPTIILTVAIANSVHILVTFLHDMRNGTPKNKALGESLRINLQPVFLASITTAIGFLSMNFSEVPPFRHLGNLVAFGVLASFLYSTTFLPALISFLPVKVRVKKQGNDHMMARFGEFVVARRNILLWSMVAVVAVLVSFLPRNELNDIFVEYFDEDVVFRQDVDYAAEHLSSTYVIEYSLKSGEPGGISNPGFMHDVEAFSNWYRQQPETEHVNTLSDTMKRLNKNMHDDNPDYYKLPEGRDLSAQYLLLYEMNLPYGLDLNNQIDIDKSSTRVLVTTIILSSNHLIELEKRAAAWLEANAPNIAEGMGSGTTLMFAHIGKRNIISMLKGTTLALIMISFILVLAFRSFKIGMISIVPNLVPAAMGFGIWGIFVGEVGLGLSVVSGMTLGIVVDDTVHFLSKYLRARREGNLNPGEAVKYAFNTVGRALLVTSVVLVAGFLVLALSDFKLNSGMGLLTSIIIALALIADFLLLPSLLLKIEEKRNENTDTVADQPDPAST